MKNETILVVDDNQDICEVLFDWLAEECRFNVIMANSGNEALDILKQKNIDHVLTDVKMPNGSGYDLLLGIKNLNLKLKTVMIMTGYSDIKELEFRSQGADYFFQKPLDLFQISEILKKRSEEKFAYKTKLAAPSTAPSAVEIEEINTLDCPLKGG